MRKGQKMSESARLEIIERMRGNNYGSSKKGSVLSPEVRKKVSDGLRKAWADGRVIRNVNCLTNEEKILRKKIAAHNRYESNRDRLLREQKEWHLAHPGEKKKTADKYYEANRDKINSKQREKNKLEERKVFMLEYGRKHRRENPGLYLAYSNNRRSAKLNAEGSHTDAEWIAVVKVFNYCCAYCGVVKKLTRDHNVPLTRGGSNYISNIVPACGSCNSKKGTLTGDEYFKRLFTESKL